MATTETWQYRGYDIVPIRQWSQWCVGIYPNSCRSSHSDALDAHHPRRTKGRCGSRSQTEDRPHSRARLIIGDEKDEARANAPPARWNRAPSRCFRSLCALQRIAKTAANWGDSLFAAIVLSC